MSEQPEPTARELLDGIVAQSQARAIAKSFVRRLRDDFGMFALRTIDRLNAEEKRKDVCHSHDVCDANEYMDAAFQEVTGKALSEYLPDVPDDIGRLWSASWDYAQQAGFVRLGGPIGDPDLPPEDIEVDHSAHTMTVTLPGAPPLDDGYPLEVELDYWGRNPRLQVICRNHNDPEGASVVSVCYNAEGRVVEVLINDSDINVINGSNGALGIMSAAAGESPWEIERESNPPCRPGDRLQCPSGQVGQVMRLRTRYDNDIEQFRAYYDVYKFPYIANNFASVEEAWEANPLTVSTTEPGDASLVPELPPLPNEHAAPA